EGDEVVFDWREKGGPTVVAAPLQTGFGSELSNISIVSQLGGKIERDWQPGGLVVKITVPRQHL
ncbi:MAG TPA: histidine kinase, partial [Sphingorhabdus sp.]|nr:histidine kinase [Sphingorhabdus sp.]